MKHGFAYISLLLAGSLTGVLAWSAASRPPTTRAGSAEASPGWNRSAAAKYLDEREVWWQYWPAAKRDHGTICISCHTVVPYAMARSALGRAMGQSQRPVPEGVMLANVEKRVNHWPEMASFYSDAEDGPGKTAQSRSTEAVLNAVVLASADAQSGTLRPVTRKAFDEAWALQETSGADAGAWKWEVFNLAPWESSESAYQGAALFLLAAENAPDNYASAPQVQQPLHRLQTYLRKYYAEQPIVNRLYILWGSDKHVQILTETERKSLIHEIQQDQDADGGWSLTVLDPGTGWKQILKRRWMSFENPSKSDGYATGLAVLALESAGENRSSPAVAQGIHWLESNQQHNGSWRAYSLNERRDPRTNVGKFMTDAATAYAVMALGNKG